MFNNELEIKNLIESKSYHNDFWNSMRNARHDNLDYKSLHTLTGSRIMPLDSRNLFYEKLKEKSVFRQLSTILTLDKTESSIFISDSNAKAKWVNPDDKSNIQFEVTDNNWREKIKVNKLASLFKLPTNLVFDKSFDIEDYVSTILAKSFANAENESFIHGESLIEPVGILSKEKGAKIGHTSNSISLLDIKKLYFSLDSEYRENATWIMNDETALYLQELKDSSGNNLWNYTDNTLLGKPVKLVKEMKPIEIGNKPIAFGDFSYYWILDRFSPTINTLSELFADKGLIGYLAYEFLDGRLVNRDAIKVIEIIS